jgi:hypothetical protein
MQSMAGPLALRRRLQRLLGPLSRQLGPSFQPFPARLKAVDLGGRVPLGLGVGDVIDDRLNRHEPTPRDLE